MNCLDPGSYPEGSDLDAWEEGKRLPPTRRVIMYYVETTAICCHTHFGQFLGSHQTLGEGGDRCFCRFYLAICNARTSINKSRIIYNLHFLLETNLQELMYFNTP